MKAWSTVRSVQKKASSRRRPLGSRTMTMRTGWSRSAPYQRAVQPKTSGVTDRPSRVTGSESQRRQAVSLAPWASALARSAAARPCPERRVRTQAAEYLDVGRAGFQEGAGRVGAIDHG